MTKDQVATLTQLIDQALADPADSPHDVARATIGTLPADLLQQMALRGWTEALMARIRMRRSAPVPVDELGLTRISYRDVELEARWKRLANMTLGEVEAVAAEYRERAHANAAKAARWEALAAEMRRRRVIAVAKVPKTVLAQILGPDEDALAVAA